MKTKHVFTIHKMLRYLCISWVIVFGVISIIGSGGGGGDGGGGASAPDISNLSFSPTSTPEGSGGGTIPVSGTLDFVDSDGNVSTLTLNIFDSNDNLLDSNTSPIEGASGVTSGTIEGVYDVNTSVAGNYTLEIYITDTTNLSSNILSGIFTVTDRVTIDYNYLQYRTPSNEYRGYLELTKDGIPVVPADIIKIELKDSNGDLVNLDSVVFSPTTYFYGIWNPGTATVDFSGPASYSGFMISFPEGFNLPADDYTWEVTTSDNKLVSKQINYPGQKVLPFVDSATMQSVWQPDGSLELSWTNPPNNPPGDYDQLRLVIRDQNAGEVLYARLPANANKMTIPSDWVNIIEDYYVLTNTIWSVQTRSHTVEDMNYARGYSNWETIPDFGP